MNLTFGDCLRRERAKKSMTQAELARRSGVKLQTIEYFESRKSSRQPSLGNILKLAAGLGITASELIAGLKVDMSQQRISGIISSERRTDSERR